MIQSEVLITSRFLCSMTTTVFPLVHQPVDHAEQLRGIVLKCRPVVGLVRM